MTDRVLVTDILELEAVLARLARAAATRGWRVAEPADVPEIVAEARADRSHLRLSPPIVVTLEAEEGRGPVDAADLLRRMPVAGAHADCSRRRDAR